MVKEKFKRIICKIGIVLSVLIFNSFSSMMQTQAIAPNQVVIPPDGGGTTFFKTMQWINRSGLVSFSVDPRTDIYSIISPTKTPWGEVLYYGSPDVKWSNTGGMKDQFDCHYYVVGLYKTPWNLEPSRPDKSYIDTVLAGCNPT